jgi:hypothetical protein
MSEPRNQTLRPLSQTDSEKTAARSVGDLEKKEVGESGMPSAAASVLDTAADSKRSIEKEHATENVAGTSDDDDDFEYPTKWRLAAITMALCLSVFCMALVRPSL